MGSSMQSCVQKNCGIPYFTLKGKRMKTAAHSLSIADYVTM